MVLRLDYRSGIPLHDNLRGSLTHLVMICKM
jgi:hypothetical protein